MVATATPRFALTTGDILADPAPILVCPVNCRPGVMGKGLAKAFADRFPGLKDRHKYLCRTCGLSIARPVLSIGHADYHPSSMPGDRPAVKDIIFFPTKDDWRQPSRYDWIFRGLASLHVILCRHGDDPPMPLTIAMPALGCGLGGLDWGIVRPMIRAWAAGLPVRYGVRVYEPKEGA